mgnify:CR=1 FL=1
MNGQGGWIEQAIILIEGQTPFFADHPDAYIAKLEQMHSDPLIAQGIFWTYIGQFKDALEQHWNKGVPNDEKGHRRNGHRARR